MAMTDQANNQISADNIINRDKIRGIQYQQDLTLLGHIQRGKQ